MIDAERLVQQMRSQGVAPNSVVFGTLIDGWCRVKRPDEALAALHRSFEHKQLQGPSMFTLLMGAYCNVGRFEEAISLLEVMMKKDVAPTPVHFTLLIEALTRAGRLEKAEEVVAFMQRTVPERDPRAHSAILDLYARIEQHEALARKPDAAATQAALDPRLLRWSRRIKEAVGRGDVDFAVNLLDSMAEAGVHPNVIVYTTVVGGLARRGDVERLRAMLTRMQSAEVPPNEVTYVSAIEGLRNSGKHEAAAPLLARLKAEYPASKHVTRLAHFTQPGERATPEQSALSIAIRDLMHQRRMAEAEALLAAKRAEGVRPHIVIWNTMISGWAKVRDCVCMCVRVLVLARPCVL